MVKICCVIYGIGGKTVPHGRAINLVPPAPPPYADPVGQGKIVAVGHVILRTKDLSRSLDFYRNLVGLRQVIKGDFFNAFEVGDVHFCIMPGKPGRASFDFTSDDVDALHARLAAAGVRCTPPEEDKVSGHRGFEFHDPDGHEITVNSAHEPNLPGV